MNRRNFLKGAAVITLASPILTVKALMKSEVKPIKRIDRDDSLLAFPDKFNALLERVEELEAL